MERSPLIAALGLTAHPEGGWYRETWRAPVSFTPPGRQGPRAAATAITFLLQAGESSRWHRVRSDELWLWQGLGPLTLSYGGSGASPVRSHDTVLDGTSLQVLVPGGVWQAAEPATGEGALVACIVAPGFDFADFELA